MNNIYPIIMAGGSGTRLWPLSRKHYPKQFLPLTGKFTMMQETILRLQGLDIAPPLLICNEEHRFIAAEQVRQIESEHSGVLLEPVGRNTAPAIALAALKAQEDGSDPLLLVLAADHVIEDVDAFHKAVKQAQAQAEQGKLVTFGIVPNKPETGYGYIQQGEVCGDAFEVAAFVEKPNLNKAQAYISSGEYLWNSGMFLFKASRYLSELEQFQPDIYSACKKSMANSQQDMDFIRIDKDAFDACPEDSIDYAVMERTADAVVVPMDAGWNDVGGFSALWDVSEKCENGNTDKGDVLHVETSNTLTISENKLVATVGVDNLIIIDTKDALLVAHRDRAQEVKKVVQQLQLEGRSEAILHREVARPWGTYDSVDEGDRFKVKRITVKPGAKLSVQMHHHRAEHWVVVKGSAKVTNGDSTFIVTENESTYIPIGQVHALENPGRLPLEMIEVQSGSYLGEDDIVRFEDRYGRVDRKAKA